MSVLIAIAMMLATAGPQSEGPRTVNGQSLGSAEDFRNAGPARICIESVSIDLIAGETATLDYAGIHSASVKVDTPTGELLLSHCDACVRSRPGPVMVERPSYSIQRSRGRRYVLLAPTDYSDGKRVPVLTVTGSALRGGGRDLKYLERIAVAATEPEGCQRHYRYGWDMLLGEEPFSKTEEP